MIRRLVNLSGTALAGGTTLAPPAPPPPPPGAGHARSVDGARTRLAAGVTLQRIAQASGLVVDEEARSIDGVAVITAGPCFPINAEPFEADEESLASVVRAINEAPLPVRVHVTHPMLGMGEGADRFAGVDGVLRLVGVITHARIEGGRARGRVTLGAYAEASPLGRMATYLLGIAREHPTSIGLSIRILMGWLERNFAGQGLARLRVDSLMSVDFVGDPGGNSAGLLAAAPGAFPAPTALTTTGSVPERTPLMYTTAQLQYLESIGLKAGATPAEIDAFVAKLGADEKVHLAGLGAPAPTASTATTSAAATAGAVMSRAQPAAGAGTALANAPGAAAAVPPPAPTSAAGTVLAAQIRQVAELAGLGPQWALDRIADGVTVERATELALASRTATHQAVPTGAPRIEGGRDRNVETLEEAISDAILLRAGVPVQNPHARAGEFRGRRVVAMAKRMLVSLGVPDADNWSDNRVAEMCLNQKHWHKALRGTALAEGTYYAALSPFSNILATTVHKAMQRRYTQLEPQWPEIAERHIAIDFKPVPRPIIGAVPALAILPHGHATTYATRSDGGESIQLSTYTNGWVLTFQQLTNDELGAFDSDPQDFAYEARDLEDALIFGILTTNPTMSDTVALFHATHGNLAASGAVLSEATVQQARTAMAKQTRLGSSQPLNLMPARCIVPVEYDFLARKLFESAVAKGETSDVKNVMQGLCKVVPTARIPVTQYFFSIAPGTRGNTLELVLLEGYEEPRVRSEEDFDSLTMKFQGVHFVGAKALDHRGLYKNPGA